MKKIEEAHFKAMKALQKIKEKPSISEDVVKNIKKAHQDFLEKQEKREQETFPSQFFTSQELFLKEYAANAAIPSVSKRNKKKRMYTIGSIVIILFLAGIGLSMFRNRDIPTYDTITMTHDTWNEYLERNITREFILTYPTRIGRYDLTDFYKELFKRYFLGASIYPIHWNNINLLEKEAENYNFKEAARKLLQSEKCIEDYSMSINCHYDADRKWVTVNATEIFCPTIHCHKESSFFYSLEKQKVLEFDDIFLPEKQDKLIQLIQKRIIFDHRYSQIKLFNNNWKLKIRNYYMIKKDSIWCWQFDCTDEGLELPYMYYPLSVTIAEKGLTEYLSYTLPNK